MKNKTNTHGYEVVGLVLGQFITYSSILIAAKWLGFGISLAIIGVPALAIVVKVAKSQATHIEPFYTPELAASLAKAGVSVPDNMIIKADKPVSKPVAKQRYSNRGYAPALATL